MSKATRLLSLFLLLLCCQLSEAQTLQVSAPRRAVRTAGDVLAISLPVAATTATLILKDWKGLEQGAFTAATTLGVTYALKYSIHKMRPDRSDNRSFPSMHTALAFSAATYVTRRYGWQYGVPAYALSAFVGFSRIYGKKHDTWDVLTGAAIGAASAMAFTRPYAKKHEVSVAPMVTAEGATGITAQMAF